MVEKEDFLCFLLLLHRLHSTCLKAKLSNPFIRQFDYTRRRKCFPILLSRKWNDRVVIPVCLLLCSVGPNWTSGCIAALIYPSDRLKLVKKKREKILSQRRRGNGVECSNWAETIPSHFFLIFFPPHFLGDQRLKFSYSSLCLLFCLTYFYVISSVNVHTQRTRCDQYLTGRIYSTPIRSFHSGFGRICRVRGERERVHSFLMSRKC